MSQETTHSSFDEGALEQYYDAVTQVIKHKTKRYVNVSQIVLRDPATGKPIVLRVTISAEPKIFGETIYPDKTTITTATCEQLKQMERDNGVEV